MCNSLNSTTNSNLSDTVLGVNLPTARGVQGVISPVCWAQGQEGNMLIGHLTSTALDPVGSPDQPMNLLTSCVNRIRVAMTLHINACIHTDAQVHSIRV